MALHGGDQRLAAGGERLPVALHPALLDLQHGRLRQFVEIGAGGERRAISGEDDDPGIGALVPATAARNASSISTPIRAG